MGNIINDILNKSNEVREPKIGVFYYVFDKTLEDGKIIGREKSAKEVSSPYDLSFIHLMFWKDIANTFSEYSEINDYAYFPRGRVVYISETDTYRILIDKCLNNKYIIDQIISYYCLSNDNTEVNVDDGSHYSCCLCSN